VRVALFTHNFLEPTHHAIAQLLGAMSDCSYTVYATRFEDHFDLGNIRDRIAYRKGPVPGLSRARFDLVHAIYDGTTAIRAQQAAAECGIPFVLSFHGGFDTHAKIHDPLFRDRSRLIAQAAAAVTVSSNQDVDRLRSIAVSREIVVLPVPVVLTARRHERRSIPGKLVTVGRLIGKKGVDLAIKALCDLPGHTLEVVGDGELRDQLEWLTKDLGLSDRVRFSGLLPISETERVLLSASALLHPARVAADGNAEGTPQIILMAQALGVPVIAADSGSLSEIVHDGTSGILVPPENPQALADAVKRLAADSALRERLERLPLDGGRSIGKIAQMLHAIYQGARVRELP
jgi:glycosyltransferase involved in cell wall biosynthesis